MMHNVRLMVLCLLVAGCSGPMLGLPGGALRGTESTFVAIPPDAGVIELETNPADPYSVLVGVRIIDGGLYIDPTAERQWYEYIAQNSAIRVRFDGHDAVHPMQAQAVTEENILSQFEADRIVFRLIPR